MIPRESRRRLARGALAACALALAGCGATGSGPQGDGGGGAPAWAVRGSLGTEEDYRRAGGIDEDAFWRANAADPGVASLPSGLRYRVIQAGDGPLVGDAPRVCVNYVTSALDGTRVADSRDGGVPVDLAVAQMNAGWREAVPRMREGAIWRLYVPAALNRPSVALGPAVSRIYDVELVHVVGGPSSAGGQRFP